MLILSEIRELAEDVIDSLCVVPDVAMRTHVLIGKLKEEKPEVVAELVLYILEQVDSGDSRYAVALGCLDVPVITEHLGNPFMSDVYTYARRNGLTVLVNLLSRPEASRVYIEEGGIPEDMPAGVRIALSRTQNRHTLNALLCDPDPRVIRTLLCNPRLTEADVLKVSTRRPVSDAVLREIYQNSKWIARYTIKKSLILNPYTPTEIGLKLLHFMMDQDLREIADSLDVHDLLRETALQKIDSRASNEDLLID